jgi:hypothetical protein
LEAELGTPEIRGEARLLPQVREELAPVREGIPDLGQEGASPVRRKLENHPVHVRLEGGQELLLRTGRNRNRRTDDRYPEIDPVRLVLRDRRESRILEPGPIGVPRHVHHQGLTGFEGADAAPKPAFDLQGHEGRAGFEETLVEPEKVRNQRGAVGDPVTKGGPGDGHESLFFLR